MDAFFIALRKFLVVFVLVLALATCGPTKDSLENSETLPVVTKDTPIKDTPIDEGTDECPNGGISIDTGIDANGNGLLDPDEVDETRVVCSEDDILTYTVGGTVSGLTGTVVLQLNNGDDLDVTTDGGFTFATEFVGGSPYEVTVLTHTVAQTCSVTNGSGNVISADITDVTVICESDIEAPTVDYTFPVNGVINLPLNATLSATFSESMEEATITASTFRLYDVTASAGVNGTISYDENTKITIFDPDEDFTVGHEYTATITRGATDLAHNSLDADEVWSFTTILDGTPTPKTSLIRNPYLQNVTKQSVDVMWGTDENITSGTLYWGNSPGNYTNNVSSTFFYATMDNADCSGNKIDPYINVVHSATISGLTAGQTVYYYVSSGSDTVGFKDASYKATTSPDDNAYASFRFIAYGDSRPRCANPYPSDNARTRLVNTMISHSPDLILHTGDIAINGRLKQFDDFYFVPTAPMAKNTPVFTTIGNHDIRWNGKVNAYRDVYSLPTNSADGTEDYYSFDYGNVHFVSLNTALLPGGYRSGYKNAERAAEMKDWLEDDLNSTTKPWKVIFFHRQYYLNDVDTAWRTIFEEKDVTLVLAGHAHHFDSHSRNGITYIVTGGGGSPLDGSGLDWFDYRIDTFSDYNFVQIDVTQGKLDISVFDIDNKLRRNIVLNKE